MKLNIPTDTKEGRALTPPPIRVKPQIFFGVTRDLIENLGKKNRLPFRRSSSSKIIPCAIY